MSENDFANNIIKFENKKNFNDNDLSGLFMGLMNLVKKMAKQEAEQNLNIENASKKFLLKKTLSEINKKDKYIKLLEEQNNNLLKENEQLKEFVDHKIMKIKKMTQVLSKYRVSDLCKEQ